MTCQIALQKISTESPAVYASTFSHLFNKIYYPIKKGGYRNTYDTNWEKEQ